MTPTFHSRCTPVVKCRTQKQQCYSKGTVPLKAAAGQRNWQHTHPGDKTGPQKRPPTPHASCTRAHTTVAHTTNMHTARTHTCTRNLDAGVHVLCGNGSSKVWGQAAGAHAGTVHTPRANQSQQKGQIQGGGDCPANCSSGPLASLTLSSHSSTCGTTTHTTSPQQSRTPSTAAQHLSGHTALARQQNIPLFCSLAQKHDNIHVTPPHPCCSSSQHNPHSSNHLKRDGNAWLYFCEEQDRAGAAAAATGSLLGSQKSGQSPHPSSPNTPDNRHCEQPSDLTWTTPLAPQHTTTPHAA